MEPAYTTSTGGLNQFSLSSGSTKLAAPKVYCTIRQVENGFLIEAQYPYGTYVARDVAEVKEILFGSILK